MVIAIALVWVGISRSQGFAGGNRRLPDNNVISRRALNWWGAFSSTDCLANRTKDAFVTHMKAAAVRLLQTWERYEASLPVREGIYGVNKLYLRPFLCCERDLDVAVSRLEQGTEDRERVAYLSAPTKRGKSAAVLPMFCRSVELGGQEQFHPLSLHALCQQRTESQPDLTLVTFCIAVSLHVRISVACLVLLVRA